MRLGVLFSGGKDSTYAAYLAKKEGHELCCLVTIESKNPDSYMFHTPNIDKVKRQAERMGLPLLCVETQGEKELELAQLAEAMRFAVENHRIEGIVTGAVLSVYQASRVQKLCNELGLWCFNPLWQKDQLELLKEIIESHFEAVICSVAAFPLDESWLGRKIDSAFVDEMRRMQEEFSINPAGEGGEYESFVLNCPMFSKPLRIVDKNESGSGNCWKMEIDVK